MLAETLGGFDPFQDMGASELATVARHARTLKLPAQRWLLRPGRRLGGRYYLMRGTVRLFSPQRDLRPRSAAARQALYPGCEAMFTRSEVELLHVDSAAIALILGSAQSKPEAQQAPDWEHRFRNSALLRRLDPKVWQQLRSALTERPFQEGDRLVVEGSAAHDFFVLKSGHAAVRRRGQTIAHLGPGDFFGEDALLLNARRNATIIATRPGSVLRLPKDRFMALLVENLVRFVDRAGDGVCIDVSKNGTLARLRESISTLDPRVPHHIVGGEPRERALAAFILNQKGFDARPVE